MEILHPDPRKVTQGIYKLIDGRWHKRCTGPAHDEPVWLPANTKYFYPANEKSGKKLHARCRLCNNWNWIDLPGTIGYIEIDKVWHFYQEAVSRVGLAELTTRTGISHTGLWKVLNKQVRSVRKRNFRILMLELISMRRKNEHSINNGARWRNERRLIDHDNACAECGTPLANYTDGCWSCGDRRNKRRIRSQAA